MAEQTTPTRQQTRQTANKRSQKKTNKPVRKPWKVWGFRIYMLICFAVAIGLGYVALQFWIPENVETYVQRLDQRPLLETTIVEAANTQLATLGTVAVEQRGPVMYFTIEVSPETDQQTAKDLAWQSVQTFVQSVAGNTSDEQPLGDFFTKYEAQIVIQQTGATTGEETLYKDPNNEEGDVLFPLFGVVNDVNSQTIKWTNNN
ncbi:MAG: hypothetical protein ACRCWD_00895 [Culicoidibacterales bacterium]